MPLTKGVDGCIMGKERGGIDLRIAGIICECNPLHGGHLYLMEQARRSGADAVVCVMSGCFTQRGEAAILEPRVRARMILDEGGADAVFELPYPYSAAGAEFFAAAGVSLLDRLGVNEIWFGSECGDISALKHAAEVSSTDQFCMAYRDLCREGSCGTAEGYLSLLREACGMEEVLSNDLLGIAYLKAMAARGSTMQAHTVKRKGSGYRDEHLPEQDFPSATALRRSLEECGIDAWKPYFSKHALRLVQEELRAHLAPASLSNAERAILSHFRLTPPDALERVPELSGGLGRRMADLSHLAKGLEEFIRLCVTKKYTESRIRRGILYAMTGITAEDLRREPAYAVLLAANDTGCRFLADRKKSRSVPVVTCHADLPRGEDAARQEALTRAAFALYGLTLPSIRATDRFLRRSSEIIRG